MSTSSFDAQHFLTMTDNESYGKKEKLQKEEDLGQWHASSVLFFQNHLKHGDGGGANSWFKMLYLAKIFDRVIFGSDLIKMNQATRFIKSR